MEMDCQFISIIHIWQMRDVTYASFSRVDINAPVDVPTNDGSIKCHHCNDRLKVNDMRMHVGRHILRKTLASPHSVSTCGYCGQGTCISTLVVSSQRGQKKYYKVETDCCYKFQTSKSKAAFTARNKCTNVVLECYICHKSIWKYNLPLHMAEQHVGVDVLDADIVSEEEKSFFSKK